MKTMDKDRIMQINQIVEFYNFPFNKERVCMVIISWNDYFLENEELIVEK